MGEGDVVEERISWFPVPADDELEEPEQKLFAKAREKIGFVPNVFRAYAWRPERFRAWFAHFKSVMDGTPGLSARQREMISVAVSMANGCLYCLVAHGAALREQSDDKVQADRITFDHRRADLTLKERAMLDFAVKLTKDPGACDEGDIEALKAHGFGDEDVWDIIEVASMYNFTNRLAMATGMLPNREYHSLAR
jgi:uncharacterized peroxidase-related enzyme